MSIGTAVQAQAPAPPPLDPACTTWSQRALAHNTETNAHNAEAPSIDRTDVGAVTSFDNVSKQLNDEKATLDEQRAGCVTQFQQMQKSARAGAPGKSATGPKPPRGPPTAIEKRNAPMAEKVNDPAYLDRYYDNAGPDGELRRRNANQIDENGEPVPIIRQDPADSTRYIAAAAPTPPKFVPGSVDHQTASLPQWMDASEAMEARSMAILSVKTWLAQKQSEIADTGAATAQTEAELSQAYAAQTSTGQEIGRYAGDHFLDYTYPLDRYDRSPPLTDPNNTRSGTFDKVYEVTDKSTGKKKIVIVEEKGPESALGTRVGLKNEDCKQGSRCYYDSIVNALTRSSSEIEQDLGLRLLATADSDIEYVLVRAAVASEQRDGVVTQRYDGYRSEQFDLTR
ncbi:hypothetical protein [Nocardia sp. alder85J]|uniref:hypothetical protein n=1 Tax=Nocardia sp. alder85J TaxID=2862949 RepID=UPI001CD45FA6|nr:hypothetical protein [Nocardia sp. alder85J]MCX4096108.1 hypothetical protein [Nocardia sp. alder85J]